MLVNLILFIIFIEMKLIKVSALLLMTVSACEDYDYWVDDYGSDCYWYNDNPDYCGYYGDDAWIACCACGGGMVGECYSDPFWTDDWGDGCDSYQGNEDACWSVYACSWYTG